MPFLPFPEWRPDVSDYRGASSLTIQNVLPRGDGYGPFPDFNALSQPLPAACRGTFFARNPYPYVGLLFLNAHVLATRPVRRRCFRRPAFRPGTDCAGDIGPGRD